MKSTNDWKPGQRIRILVYGPSKAGKTFGALSFPRPCVMDFDRGIAVSHHPDFITKYGKKEILYEEFYEKSLSKQGVPTAHNAFDDASKFFDEMMKPDNVDKFDTWVIDSATMLFDAAATKAIILLGGSFKGVSSTTHSEAIKHGLVVPKLQDYGAERSMAEQFIDMLLSTDKHLVLIAHERIQTNDAGNVVAITPLLTGKSVASVCLKFDEIYNLQVKGNVRTRKRELLTDSDGIRIAGSRYGVPSGIEFDYDAIVSSLQKEKK